MKNLTLRNLTEVCSGTWHGDDALRDREISAITTDSRKIEKDCLFVPIVGERVDAHRFIPDVMTKGALATLSERELPEADYAYIQVDASLQAVKDIAEFYLEQLQIPVVGITGSVGKTSTKEVIASVLKEKYRTLKTQGNFNNELGLPLTVFRLRDEDQIAVLEMGISDFGEMARLTKIAKPDTCVITNIGTCHLENLGDRDGVLKAKTEIFQSMKPNGHIVLNGDDDKLITVREYNGVKPVFFGLNSERDVYADQVESKGLKGVACRIHLGEDAFDVLVPTPGIHMVYNALAAAAVGRIYGLTIEEISLGMITKLKEQAGVHSGVVSTVLDAVADAIAVDDEEVPVYTSGATNIFKYPELADSSKASELISAFEDKQELVEMIKDTVSDSGENTGIQVYIGNESPIQTMKDCSVVTASYDLGEGMKGTIGIIGPKRMDYENVVDNLKTLKVQLDNIFKKP